ncbi:hypothetical protein COLO4_11934 [Corchorus olitorius]|uniref:Uncharacterized protein n=1 Tax=Corchorus olitorius TaxID=93759 RepID=A0A1R3K2S0_9ROSI|nr:hypothetical protein COLO4_11934 [Corchorus olitorius]
MARVSDVEVCLIGQNPLIFPLHPVTVDLSATTYRGISVIYSPPREIMRNHNNP